MFEVAPGDLNEFEDVVKRRLFFPRPLFTRRVKMYVEDAAPDVLMKLDFVGNGRADQYSRELNIESEFEPHFRGKENK